MLEAANEDEVATLVAGYVLWLDDFSPHVLMTETLVFSRDHWYAGKFDLIFLDPPYASGLMDAALKKINKFDILADGGIIICETDSETTLKALDPPYFIGRTYKYGKVKLTVCGKQA